MNIREMAIEYVRKHPGCTSRQIADGAGISRRLIQPLMAELFAAESVVRDAPKGQPFVYRIPDGSELANLNKEYLAYPCRRWSWRKNSCGVALPASGCWLWTQPATRLPAIKPPPAGSSALLTAAPPDGAGMTSAVRSLRYPSLRWTSGAAGEKQTAGAA